MGTGSAVPTLDRAQTTVSVLRGSELILFDAGEGVQRSLLASKLGLGRKMKIFLTHLHGDHCIGILGLLQTMALMNRDKPLDVYGPPGIAGFIKNNMNYLNFALTYDLRIHRIHEGVVAIEDDYRIEACLVEHSIRSYAYRLTEAQRPGIFYPERAIALGIPEGKLWSTLQKGESIGFGGKNILPEDVLGPRRRGRSIGISGDTRPTSKLIKFFEGCDLLVFDSTYGDDHAETAVEHMHSTAREAAEVAHKACVKTLVLTHFSPRYNDVNILVAQASSIHPRVMAAYDMMSLDIPYPD